MRFSEFRLQDPDNLTTVPTLSRHFLVVLISVTIALIRMSVALIHRSSVPVPVVPPSVHFTVWMTEV